ncbi:MAG TPA: NADP-dependent oxidoreductase [Usitatibacteraceae bacterium]|nr:NADP-dependent oxidoreductase [Usitatibacteraceae bacterium]
MSEKNLQVILASRPAGTVVESDFRLAEAPLPEPRDGELLVRVDWLSLDPYMRGRMNEGKSYAARVELGEVMVGGTIGTVVASRHAKYAEGEKVLGMQGWQRFAVSDGQGLVKLPDPRLPPTVWLSATGMPGITAWMGLGLIGTPKAGETVVVSAASGAVGSVAGQLAKIAGCRAVGIAGGAAKCDYVVKELGFDACVDYKAGQLDTALKAAAPSGVDVYFDNVGGEILDAVLRRANVGARVALCGLISGYDGADIPIRNVFSLLVNRVRLQGFIVSDRMDLWPGAMRELAGHVAAGRIKYRETIAQGLESAPRAFIGMLKGENFGKQLVKVS